MLAHIPQSCLNDAKQTWCGVTENKSRLGTNVTTTVTGEPVRAFIPPRLPPNPPVELGGCIISAS